MPSKCWMRSGRNNSSQKKKKKKKKKDLLTITKVIPKISKRAHAYFQVLNLDRNLQENTNILLYCKTI